ncbi:uncharacterized protein LOC117117520 [Anneissia japonica]|uniref:uncharacterized protein LOC117117520 n=1 Tax=Anneissia japonica TaxID=1529436 RepID=UPI0014257412|nr:uncharacterized protein LOC117117520 [Anneissia japonica]
MTMAMAMANNMEGMRRKPNFSLDEKLFLINYIKEHKSIHEQIDPYVGDLTKSLNGWTEIAAAFEKHFPGKTSRDPNDLRSCWKRIRDKARCIYAPNSTPLAPNKQLTKPKWLEKKKPVPNIVSQLAWEFMVQQECAQGTQLGQQCYIDVRNENDWPQHPDPKSSYDQQLHSAESPELLVMEQDDSDIGETDNDVIRIKKEWINEDDAETVEVLSDTEKLQDFSENAEGLPTSPKPSIQEHHSLTSPSRKDTIPKIMMVESLQSETRRKLDIPGIMSSDTGHHLTTHTNEVTRQMSNQNNLEHIPGRLNENILRNHVETTRADKIHTQFSSQEIKGQHEGQKSFSESGSYVGQRPYREKSPRSQGRQFPEDKQDSRRGSSGQESMEGNRYFPGQLPYQEGASTSQKEDSMMMSHSIGSQPGFRPNRDNSPGFSQTHPPGFRPDQDNPTGFRPGQGRPPGLRSGEAQVPARNTSAKTSRNAVEPERPHATDPRNASVKKTGRMKVAINAFDRRQSKYYQGLRYRRTRNLFNRRERVSDDSRNEINRTVLPNKDMLPHQEVPMAMNEYDSSSNRHTRGQRFNQVQNTSWRSRSSINEANAVLEDFEQTTSSTGLYRYPSHTASTSPVMEPLEKRRRSSSSFGEDTGSSTLKMAQEEHNIKMQIHKRKLRILILEQWALEQECLQAGYDLPPDYY